MKNFNVINYFDFGLNGNLGSGVENVLDGLSGCKKSLRTVLFSGCGLKEENIQKIKKSLKNFNSLNEINLESNENLGSGILPLLYALHGCQNSLKKLYFWGCGLTDQNIIQTESVLFNFKAIKNINFGWNNKLGSGIKWILDGLSLSQSSCKKMSFKGCNLNEENAFGIENVLQKYNSVYDIDFGANENLGSGVTKIIYGLRYCKNSLEIISFEDCGLNEENIKNIKTALENFNAITEIDFGSNENLGSGIINVIDGLKNCKNSLQRLSFWGCGLNCQNLTGIENKLLIFNTINSINFRMNVNLSSGLINILDGLNNCQNVLQKLSFKDCGLSEKRIKGIQDKLKNFSTLSEIDFGLNKNLGLAIIWILNGLNSCHNTLHKLYFNRCNINLPNGTDFEIAFEHFKNINEIDFESNETLGSGIINILRGLKYSQNSLNKINFKNCGLNEFNMKRMQNALHNFTSINEVQFDSNSSLALGVIPILNGLNKCKNSLLKISFCHCGLNEESVKGIENVLRGYNNLQSIDFGSNEHLGRGSISILKGLIECQNSLEKLSLNQCGLSENNVNGIERVLQNYKSITEINFGYNENLGSGVIWTLNGLKKCKNSLKKISFNQCGLHESHASGIEKALHNYNSISEINFAWNKNLGCGIVSIINGLTGCKNSLEKLSFNGCGLRKGHMCDIEDLLKSFTAIIEINFSSNENLGSGVVSILNGLSRCQNSLQEVSFCQCGLGKQDERSIKNMQKNFSSIYHIKF